MRKRIAALALASVMALSLIGCGGKSNSASSAGVSGDFTGTAKGMGGDVTVTLTLTDSKITGCTAEGRGNATHTYYPRSDCQGRAQAQET